MEERFETPSRERWAQVLAQHKMVEETEYRRDDARRIVEFGSVRVIYQEWGSWVARSGTLLNASERGLMAMVKERVPSALQVRLEVTIRDETFALTGRVAHCTQTVGGFKIGFRLEFAPQKAADETTKAEATQSGETRASSRPTPARATPQTSAEKVAAETARVRRLIRQRKF